MWNARVVYNKPKVIGVFIFCCYCVCYWLVYYQCHINAIIIIIVVFVVLVLLILSMWISSLTVMQILRKLSYYRWYYRYYNNCYMCSFDILHVAVISSVFYHEFSEILLHVLSFPQYILLCSFKGKMFVERGDNCFEILVASELCKWSFMS